MTLSIFAVQCRQVEKAIWKNEIAKNRILSVPNDENGNNPTSDYISKIIDFKVHVGDRKKVQRKSWRIFGWNIWRQIESNTCAKSV